MISREQIVEESVQYAVKGILTGHGYGGDKVQVVEAFPDRIGELDKTYVAVGFNFDDGGEHGEMGSDLTRRTHTIEFFIFGQTLTWARNVASVVKFGLQSDPNDTLPLLDLEQDPPAEMDKLLVDSCRSERQPVPEPEPWQQFVWTVHLVVTDEYYASLVG